MFSNVFRSQARLSLLAARSAAVPASRSFSVVAALAVGRQTTLIAAPVSRLAVASRAFSSGRVLSLPYEQREEREVVEPSASVFIGNMPWNMTKEDLTDMFSEFGEIESVRLQTHADGRPRGFAHITFISKDSASAAVSSAREEPLHVSGRDLNVDYARRPAATYTKMEPNNKMYFASFNGDEGELRTLLGEYKDSIVSVYFMRDGNTGEKLPSGFVEFNDISTSTEVINKLNGTTLEDGNTLRVSYARARKDAPAGGSRTRYPRQEKGPRKAHYTSREYRSNDRNDDRSGERDGGQGGENSSRW